MLSSILDIDCFMFWGTDIYYEVFTSVVTSSFYWKSNKVLPEGRFDTLANQIRDRHCPRKIPCIVNKQSKHWYEREGFAKKNNNMWLYDGNLDEVREREERALFVMFQQNIADLTAKPRLNKTFLIDNWYILWHIPIWVWHIQFPWNIKREWNYQSEVIRRKVQHHRRWLQLRNALWGFKVHSRGNQL